MNYDLNDPGHFLNTLPLSDVEKQKLGDLAPKSAFDLLARRQSAQADFDSYVGHDRADAIAGALQSLLSNSQRAMLAESPGPLRKLGARLDKRP